MKFSLIIFYFMVVGSVLVVLLLITNWFLPELPQTFRDYPEVIERASIRIKSAHKWPEKVVLDTSKRTMTPPVIRDPSAAQSSIAQPSDEAQRRSNIEAIAQLKPNILPGAIGRPTLQTKRGVARTARSRRVARGSSTVRLAGPQTSRGCCQFEKGQASSNAMSRRFVPPWPFE
jgi:hypothetical protein